jgi:hypothetical protein
MAADLPFFEKGSNENFVFKDSLSNLKSFEYLLEIAFSIKSIMRGVVVFH